MPTSTKSRRTPQPVSGTYRWVLPLGPGENRPGVLSIKASGNAKLYGVIRLMDQGRTVGYRLVRPDGGTYDVDADLWVCSCPDATYRPDRPGGCRHVKALR